MVPNLNYLGEQVKLHREHRKETQYTLANKLSKAVNRTLIAHLEQGRKLPEKNLLAEICEELQIPKPIWEPFLNKNAQRRADFESILIELIGEEISSLKVDDSSIEIVEQKIQLLFSNKQPEHSFDNFNGIIIFYGIRPVTNEFFENYFPTGTFRSLEKFRFAVEEYLKDAIRLFSTISEAYEKLNKKGELVNYLSQIEKRSIEKYTTRSTWDSIDLIPDEDLPFLGYIAAEKVKSEAKERKELSSFLLEVADKKETNTFDINSYPTKTKRRIDSHLRKFNSRISHGLFSPLFNPDSDLLREEANYVAPDNSSDINRMAETQDIAYKNLGNYLTADYMDVYVATSMRSEADFVSVNQFVEKIFVHDEIEELKLRYFNPTQSWIQDRVAKGLVEALMLRRASICIYMAQKNDTFGKDSEASVTLGQGKPVVVYVPRLFDSELNIDSENLGSLDRKELLDIITKLDKKLLEDIDDTTDLIGLCAVILEFKLNNASNDDLIRITNNHWADFDLFGEAEKRINTEADLLNFKKWLKEVVKLSQDQVLSTADKKNLINILVSNSVNYEKRATVFKEIHPLALQVILSSGVLNGIIVVRSIDGCAKIIRNLVENNLNLELSIDDNNYRIVEVDTKSTIRVISRHKLLSNTFNTFYKK